MTCTGTPSSLAFTAAQWILSRKQSFYQGLLGLTVFWLAQARNGGSTALCQQIGFDNEEPETRVGFWSNGENLGVGVGRTALILELILNTPLFTQSRSVNNLGHPQTHMLTPTERDAWTTHLDYG